MIKVLFVCHGNICRSPMAEFLLKDMVNKAGLADKFQIASAATSREEIGNPVHYGTRNKLEPLGISTKGKTAVQMTKKDYDYYDYIIIMDENNRRNALRLLGKTQARSFTVFSTSLPGRAILQTLGIQVISIKLLMTSTEDAADFYVI